MTDIAVALGLLLLIVVTVLGAVDSRDGRDWQPRPDWLGRDNCD